MRDDGGFTLIEVLVSMALLTVLFAAMSTVLGGSIRQSGQLESDDTLQTEARAGLAQLSEDLRGGYSADGSPAISSLGPSQITFRAPDRTTPFHLREIAYQVVGGELQRSESASTNTDGPPWTMAAFGPWQTIVGSVSDPSAFTFLDANGAATTIPAQVREVDVDLKIESPGSNVPTDYTMDVELRTQP